MSFMLQGLVATSFSIWQEDYIPHCRIAIYVNLTDLFSIKIITIILMIMIIIRRRS